MDYGTFFHTLTANIPYKFQQTLADKLIAGRSLILRAPTGAGKTWATVAPFLYSIWRAQPLGDRLLYALPLRSLASSLHATVLNNMRTASGIFPDVNSAGKDRSYNNSTRYCSIQMGGEPHDPFFESDLVFTTIDQLLSGYLGLPVSLPHRLGNMVAGALIGAFIVLDEVHLLESDRAMGTTIEMLHRLRGLAQFVLMTATLSDRGMTWLASKLDAEPFFIPDADVRELPSQKTKQRDWRWANGRLTAEAVQAAHAGGRTVALTNTVARAQSLFQTLRALYTGRPTKVMLLHARYFPKDRKAIEDQLPDYFGPDAKRTDVLLVTTQVIEAGIDISADNLLTELAPMNALIQRAGRVARYQHRNVGKVTVFDVESPRPYADARAIQATREVLQELPKHGRTVDFLEEQLWIDYVHADQERLALETYRNLHTRRQQVHEAMEGDESKLTDLVRDIDSVSLIITDRPDDLNFSGRGLDGRRIGWPRMLSVPRTSLMRLASFFEGLPEHQWIAKSAHDTGSERPGLTFQWKRVETPGMLRAQWMVAIHPCFASYDATIGLLLGVGGPPPAIEYADRPKVPRYQYDFEPWSDHAHRVCEQARKMHQSHCCGAEVLARSRTLAPAKPEHIEQIVELACMLHDAGKLAVKWQEVAWCWQRDKDARLRAQGIPVPERPSVPLAHTSFDPVADREYARLPQHQFPNHAVEGAFAVEQVVCQHFVEIWGEQVGLLGALALVSAIARHHSPHAKRLRQFKLDCSAEQAIRELAGLPLGGSLRTPQGPADTSWEALVNFRLPEHAEIWPLFAFVSRRLRLADQGSFQAKPKRD